MNRYATRKNTKMDYQNQTAAPSNNYPRKNSTTRSTNTNPKPPSVCDPECFFPVTSGIGDDGSISNGRSVSVRAHQDISDGSGRSKTVSSCQSAGVSNAAMSRAGSSSRVGSSSKGFDSQNYKNNVGATSSRGGFVKGSSKSFGSSRKFEVNENEKKITPISEVDPMLDCISIKSRCISIWQSHRLNAAHDPYSLDLVIQDVNNTRIQVYIKKEFMFRFQSLFEIGQCYILSNFRIAENGGRLPLLPHRYKISFYRNTTVTRVDAFDNNTNGFVFEPFNHLLDEDHEYYENDAVDVIGSVVGISDVVPVMSDAGKKVRRTVVIEDVDGDRIDLTFWDNWATMWDQYSKKHASIEHLVIILQLGKVKYWNGVPAIHNALFGLKIFTNPKMPEIVEFKKRVLEREGYNENQLKIEMLAPEVKIVTIGEIFHGAIRRMVGSIRNSEPDSHCIVYGKIVRVHREHGWAYTGCKRCNKKVDILTRQNRPPVYICEDHVNVQAASRFKVIVRVADESGSAPLLFFNNNFVTLPGHTAWELMEKHGMDPDEYWPEELNDIIGKEYLFKIYYSEWNVRKNDHNYRCDAFSKDVELINHFKRTFLGHDSDDEDASEEHVSADNKQEEVDDGTMQETNSNRRFDEGSMHETNSKRRFNTVTYSKEDETPSIGKDSNVKKAKIVEEGTEVESDNEE